MSARHFVLAVAASLATCLGGCTTRDADTVRRADSAGSAGATDDSLERTRSAAETPAHASASADAPDTAAPAARATGSGVDYFTAAQLDQVASALAHGPTTGRTLGSRGSYQYLQIRRVASGVPEIHDRWVDVTMVQSGRGSLVFGGRVTGGADQGGGEHRGGQIVGGARRAVGPGDLMMIPAGVPHQYEIARGDSLRYLTIKVLAPSRSTPAP